MTVVIVQICPVDGVGLSAGSEPSSRTWRPVTMLRRASLAVWGVLLFAAWNLLLLLFVLGRSPPADPEELARQVVKVAEEVEQELEAQKRLLQQVQAHRPAWLPAGPPPAPTPSAVLPVLVIGCDRPTIRRCLDKLLLHRPSKELFPVLVSQDCGHEETARVIASYGDQLTHLRQPDVAAPPVPPEHRKFAGYYRIARHYRWALNQLFRARRYEAAVVLEDDLEVAPDFFEYFLALLPVLRGDPSLWCASAWNDNGKAHRVEATGRAATALYRTDFFPGLGWMLLRSTWDELEPKWPAAFWDDWMRRPEQRRGRSCVRPEVSRTITFGRRGVSNGQFYDQHLRYIKLSDAFVPFSRHDLGYLHRERYDAEFGRRVYGAPAVRLDQLLGGGGETEPEPGPEVRLQYSSRDGFKALAKALGVMDDLKSGVPRTGYRGWSTFMYRGRAASFLAPPQDWSGYDPSWS
ncbi:LOW QUALITY PROTEIN: alpha-1,3-mannosyl-glycoprotein 2-beta-N-acetylglucosaminyltransferase-like [Narcine bancroftii]|uniref:LOW QUALITY PROTEIN: alpha-1,3-mannosyl-glycoprotein 2-beta-N-acetylglucosaminyltransferase-like n=1 Tax=Narcine bancroftii TaxID=1343680 RepID=UPI0038310C75